MLTSYIYFYLVIYFNVQCSMFYLRARARVCVLFVTKIATRTTFPSNIELFRIQDTLSSTKRSYHFKVGVQSDINDWRKFGVTCGMLIVTEMLFC